MLRIIEDVLRWIRFMVSALLRIPPVTALLNIAMILAYFKCTKFHQLLEPKTCDLQSSLMAWRALLSAFYHKRVPHLFLDLTWALITGTRMEKLLGSWRFLRTTALMIFLSQGLTLLINLPYGYLTKHPHNFTLTLQLSEYTLGFSGALFALDFWLLTASKIDGRQFTAISQNINYHHEERLVLIYAFQALILPEAHFFHNLSGILAGFLYVNSPPIFGGLLVCVMALYKGTLRLMALYTSPYNVNGNNNHHGQGRPFTSHYEYNHNEVQQEEEEFDVHLQWECQACFRKNGVFFSFCDACSQPRA